MNFKVDQKVRIIGDKTDYTDHLHGKIGTIAVVKGLDCVVIVDGRPWCIWNYNMEVVEDVH